MIIKVIQMVRYRRVSSYKIMNDYKQTALHLKYIYLMADAKNKRFFRINQTKIEKNIITSKMANNEKTFLLKLINEKDFHQIYCYASILYEQYQKITNQYATRMNDLFMTIEDKNVFYA